MNPVLSLMLLLLRLEHQRPNPVAMRQIAQAIAQTTPDRTERAALVTVAWLESGFGRYGDLRFGVILCRRLRCGLEREARIALRSLRTATAVCRSRGWATRLSRYHNGRITHAGRCVEDAYGRRGAALIDRLTR